MPKQIRGQVPAIVLGCHKLGLGVIRALGEKNIPVVGVYYNKMDMGYVSKYVAASYHCPSPDNQKSEFISFLMNLGASFPGGVLIPSDDATLIPVSMYKGQLERHFKVAATDWSITEKFIVKKHTYAIAEEIGVPAPRTTVPKSLQEAKAFAAGIGFPCLLKPTIGHRFFEVFRKKMIFVKSAGQLEDAYARAEESGMEFMIQEFIPGDDTSGVNYNSYFINGEPVAEFTAQKIRLSPPRTGFPRVVISKHLPQLSAPGREILRAIGYSGFCCMEFKRDSRNGIYKLMEINGRQNLSTPLAVRAGINFPYLTFMHTLYDKFPEGDYRFKEGIYWIDLGKDIIESAKSFKTERFTPSQYIGPYLKEHVYTIPSLHDPLPFLKRCLDMALFPLGLAAKKIRKNLLLQLVTG